MIAATAPSNPPRANLWYCSAAVAMGLTTLIHIFAGGPEVMDPVHASTLPALVIAVLSVVWHAITLLLALFTVALVWLITHDNRPLAALMFALQIGFAALFLGYGLSHLGTVWPMPQWIIFLVVPAMMLMGQRSR